ncbi:MAG: hypothetical protein WCE80_14455 [Acidimicrobiia bacterium]
MRDDPAPAVTSAERLDVLGAVVAMVIYVSSIITFSARMMFHVSPGHWIGIPFLLMAFPLGFLLFTAPRLRRPRLYYIQVGLMLSSIIILFLLDYVLGVEWRDNTWAVISFVTFYFAGMGGMIGVASRAGRSWTVSSVVLFFVTGVLAFVQRGVTGL